MNSIWYSLLRAAVLRILPTCGFKSNRGNDMKSKTKGSHHARLFFFQVWHFWLISNFPGSWRFQWKSTFRVLNFKAKKRIQDLQVLNHKHSLFVHAKILSASQHSKLRGWCWGMWNDYAMLIIQIWRKKTYNECVMCFRGDIKFFLLAPAFKLIIMQQ